MSYTKYCFTLALLSAQNSLAPALLVKKMALAVVRDQCTSAGGGIRLALGADLTITTLNESGTTPLMTSTRLCRTYV